TSRVNSTVRSVQASITGRPSGHSRVAARPSIVVAHPFRTVKPGAAGGTRTHLEPCSTVGRAKMSSNFGLFSAPSSVREHVGPLGRGNSKRGSGAHAARSVAGGGSESGGHGRQCRGTQAGLLFQRGCRGGAGGPFPGSADGPERYLPR